LRLLTRPEADIRTTADRVAAALRALWPDRPIAVEACRSQIGSGALPIDLLPSAAVTVGGKSLEKLASWFRSLPCPVIGRIAQDRFWLDCRCLEPDQEAAFLKQLSKPA
jgi:L-seryl-tRNA(Ser) seleniumtransferase